MREWNDDPFVQPNGGNGSLSQLGLRAGLSSQMTAYWPFVFLYDNSSNLVQMGPNGWGQYHFGPGVHGFTGSGLVILPIDANYSNLAVFYQRVDQKIVQFYTNGIPHEWSFGKPLTDMSCIPLADHGGISLRRNIS